MCMTSAMGLETWVNDDDSGIRVLMVIQKPVKYALARGAFRSAFEAFEVGGALWFGG